MPDYDLDNAYEIDGPNSAKTLYSRWAETYDSSFGEGWGYIAPREIAGIYTSFSDSNEPILDIGAGYWAGGRTSARSRGRRDRHHAGNVGCGCREGPLSQPHPRQPAGAPGDRRLHLWRRHLVWHVHPWPCRPRLPA